MPTSSEVDLVFADLQDAYRDLEAAANSPKQVRRAFSRFVELSQRITAVMRKEFQERLGQEWKASEFTGWNETTTLFKDLRNEEQHEKQIYLSVYETRFYKIFENEDRLLATSGTWDLTDQLMDKPPDGITFYPADPKTGQMLPNELPVARVEYQFLIQSRTESLRKRLETVGSANVHELSGKCMSTLVEYYDFYSAKIGG